MHFLVFCVLTFDFLGGLLHSNGPVPLVPAPAPAIVIGGPCVALWGQIHRHCCTSAFRFQTKSRPTCTSEILTDQSTATSFDRQFFRQATSATVTDRRNRFVHVDRPNPERGILGPTLPSSFPKRVRIARTSRRVHDHLQNQSSRTPAVAFRGHPRGHHASLRPSIFCLSISRAILQSKNRRPLRPVARRRIRHSLSARRWSAGHSLSTPLEKKKRKKGDRTHRGRGGACHAAARPAPSWWCA